ncbi:MAG: type II secretion system F family protein [bacterium]|nr:type II secretion system F family protein [bacterium]
MPTFSYVARTRDGRTERGKTNAENRQALVRNLQSRGLRPDTIKETSAKKKGGARVRAAEVMVFTRQLSTIVNAGLPLLTGLDILAEQTEDPRFAGVLDDISSDVEGGESFSDALRKHPRAFSDLFVSMVRAGEASGNLDGVLMQLADYMESMAELRRRIRAAMTYPVVAFSMILLIAIGLIMFVVPQFAEIFASFEAQLPAPTMILIMISEILWSWRAGIVVAVIIAAVIAVRLYNQTDNGRLNMDRLKLRMPIFGKTLRKVAISRFARTLSTLTRSGVAILAALEIVERTAGNEVFARVISHAGDSVRNGETLADPLARSNEFPAMVTRMIGVGEKTGALEQMLSKISDFYDSEVKATIDSLTSLIEPVLILMMGIVVGSIVVALFMPILQLSSLVNS